MEDWELYDYVEALSVALIRISQVAETERDEKSMTTLRNLRDSFYNDSQKVWTNGKALRRYQGQDKTQTKHDWYKAEVVVVRKEKMNHGHS